MIHFKLLLVVHHFSLPLQVVPPIPSPLPPILLVVPPISSHHWQSAIHVVGDMGLDMWDFVVVVAIGKDDHLCNQFVNIPHLFLFPLNCLQCTKK